MVMLFCCSILTDLWITLDFYSTNTVNAVKGNDAILFYSSFICVTREKVSCSAGLCFAKEDLAAVLATLGEMQNNLG